MDETVNAVVGEVVTPLTEETVEPEVKKELVVDNSEVAPETKPEITKDTNEKPRQSAEENARWAETRRKIEKDALDKAAKKLAELNGWDASLGNWDAYEKAVDDERVKKEAEERNIDPEFLKEHEKLKRENAEFQSEKQKTKMYREFFERYPNVKTSEIPREVWAEVEKGETLKGAYADYALNKKLKAEVEAEKIAATNKSNAQASTGGVTGKTEVDNDFVSQEEFDQKKSDTGWVQSKYDLIMKSYRAGKIKQ